MTPAIALPAPSKVIKQHGEPISAPRILPVQRWSCHRGSGAYLVPGWGTVSVLVGGRREVVESAGPASEGGSRGGGEGRSRRAMTGLWSDVVYEGMEVYSSDSIDDWVVNWSEADVYRMRSVHAGRRCSLFDPEAISSGTDMGRR